MKRRTIFWLALLLGLLLMLAALLLGAAWLAGYCYFLLNLAPPRQIRFDTWWWYWQAYGQVPAQRIRLLIAAAVPALLLLGLLVALVAMLLPRPRALYGDARWASRRDIDDAGLL